MNLYEVTYKLYNDKTPTCNIVAATAEAALKAARIYIRRYQGSAREIILARKISTIEAVAK